MTRKHFRELAGALKHVRPVDPGAVALHEKWRETVREVGNVCLSSNSLFNRDLFEKACGV